MLKKMVRPVYESPVSGVYIDPQQFSSTAGVPVHRMGDGQGYEFIYVAPRETKICQKSPGIGGAWAGCVGEFGGRRRPLPTLRPDLKSADM